jgi:hypothetical protein
MCRDLAQGLSGRVIWRQHPGCWWREKTLPVLSLFRKLSIVSGRNVIFGKKITKTLGKFSQEMYNVNQDSSYYENFIII